MSIEDVDYMKKNSIKETYTFIVDSSKRNIDEYPEPNEYVVNFDIPFKNVFGIEILDVSVPKTMYNVDTDSNKLNIYLNTTLQPINNIENLCIGSKWIKYEDNEINSNDIHLNNINIEDKLYIINNKQNLINSNHNLIDTTNISDIYYNFKDYKITNLNNNNFIKVANSEIWEKSTDIDDNIHEIYEPVLSSNISLNIDNDIYDNNITLNNLRSDNSIAVINYNNSNYDLKWYNNSNFISNYNYGYFWEEISSNINSSSANDITDTNTNLVKLLKIKSSSNNISFSHYEIFDNISFSHYEIFDNNIDLSNINNNSYIRLEDTKIYKPKSLFSVGNSWQIFDNNDDIHNFNYYTHYDNELLKNDIIDEINDDLNSIDVDDISEVILDYTTDRLNELGYDFDLYFESYLELNTSILWTIDLTNKMGTIEINKINFPEKYVNFRTFIQENLNNNNNNFKINDPDVKDKLIKLINKNKNSTHYIIVDGLRIVQKELYIIPKNDNFWLINKKLKDSIKSYLNSDENIVRIPINEWNDIGITNELTPYNFIKIDNDYYRIYPSYFYKPKIINYKPNDVINIKNKTNYNYLLENFFELFELELDIGNYTVNKLLIQLNKQIGENVIDKIKNRITNNLLLDRDSYNEIILNFKGNSDPIDLQNILKIESNRFIIIDMNKSTVDKTLGFYSKTNINNNNTYDYIEINKELEFNKFFHSIYNSDSSYYEIVAPGILYLIGTDYVILRCPEIEKHLYGSLSYTQNTMGLAKIKVSSWGLNEDSNTYLKLKLREFHPIGKLPKMTLKFEKGDTNRELYNFRGVNHNLVFTIYYYSPEQNKEFIASVINPEYDMNFMKYKYSDDNKQDNSDDDNDIIDLNEYKKKELEFSNKKYNTNNVFDYEKIRNDLYNKDTQDTDDSEDSEDTVDLDDSEDSE